jgi:SagB-type dehydrogenase family enzyme
MSTNRTDTYIEAITFEWNDIDFSQTDQAQKAPPPPIQKDYDKGGRIIALDRVEDLPRPALSVVDAILRRKSHRKFTEASLTKAELSLLLFCTQGMKFHNEKYSLRTVPSGGARHALETYLYVARVEGLTPGLYRYLPVEHALIELRAQDGAMEAQMNEALNGQLYGAAVYFLWTAIPYRTAWRYSFATAKILALDSGHACENLYLACEALGCGTCAIGAYCQEKLDGFLGLDGKTEFSIYAAPVGKVE